MGDSSSIIIEQLDGDRRRVELHGPSLPFQGAAWKTKQAVTTTWYPGNGATASQQVLGPQEMPSSWEGVWRRTLMGKAPSKVFDGPGDSSGSAIVQPTTLRDVLDEIFLSGSRLRVTWVVTTSDASQTRKSVTREGRAAEWEFPHDRAHDIAWKITFDWYSRGRVVQKVIATRDNDAVSANAALNSAMEAAVANATAIAKGKQPQRALPNAPATFNLSQIQALVGAPLALVNEFSRTINKVTSTLKQVGNLVNQVRNMPFALANSVLYSVRNAQAVSNQFVDTMSRTPAELLTTKHIVRDIVKAQQVYGQQMDLARVIADAARTADLKLRPVVGNAAGVIQSGAKSSATRPSTVQAVHVVREGETLLTISQKYYKSPEHSATIAKANHLPWHMVTIARGTVLVIPSLSTTSGAV